MLPLSHAGVDPCYETVSTKGGKYAASSSIGRDFNGRCVGKG